MKSPNNRVDRAQTGRVMSPNETYNTGIGLHLIDLFAGGSHGNPQIFQAVAQTNVALQNLTAKFTAEENTYTIH